MWDVAVLVRRTSSESRIKRRSVIDYYIGIYIRLAVAHISFCSSILISSILFAISW